MQRIIGGRTNSQKGASHQNISRIVGASPQKGHQLIFAVCTEGFDKRSTLCCCLFPEALGVRLTCGNLITKGLNPFGRIWIAPGLRSESFIERDDSSDGQFKVGGLVARILKLERIRAGAFRNESKRHFSLARSANQPATRRSVGIENEKVDLAPVPNRDVDIVTVIQGH